MFGPCWDYVYLCFTSRPVKALKYFKSGSTWSEAHVYGVCILLDHVRAMSRPCWDYVWPGLTSIPARALKFSRLDQFCVRPIWMEYLLFGILSGPCLDHVRTLIDLALLTDQLELWSFQDWINMVWILCLWSVFFLGSCQVDVWTMVGPANPYFYPFPRTPSLG